MDRLNSKDMDRLKMSLTVHTVGAMKGTLMVQPDSMAKADRKLQKLVVEDKLVVNVI